MNEVNALVYVDDDPLLSELMAGWATRASLDWIGQAQNLKETLEMCIGASGRIVLLSTEMAGSRWKEIVVELSQLQLRPAVVLFAKRFSDDLLYRAKRAPISGVVSRSAGAEKDFRAVVSAVRSGRPWFCPVFEDAVSTFEKSPHAFFKVLSTQELALLRPFGLGLPDRVIAAHKNLSPSTIQTHRKHVMRKLGLHSARDIVCWAIARGVVSPTDFPAAG